MCGIVALLSTHAEVSRPALQAAIDRLDHRGPDGQGIWRSCDGRVGLGHARLSIVDLHTGSQPLSNETGSIQLVVNGEFYGFEAIRADLERRGHSFKTRSDSEILVHLYEEHGTGCLTHLRGEFAFVLWDEPRQTLFAARDRFGIKPLCYAETDGGLAMASEAKALLAAGIQGRWDRDSVFQSLQGLMAPHRTLFQGIQQLPAAHYLLAKAGRIQLHRYWDFDYPKAEDLVQSSEEDCLLELRNRLDEAIQLRLRADVPVGVYLSGGIDSSAILGMAVRAVPDLEVFSIFFPEDPAHNEAAAIQETAERFGARLHSLSVTGEAVADHFPQAVAQWEDLPRSEWIVGKYLLSRLVRDHGTKVVLTGEGSDEVMGGHLAFAHDLAKSSTAEGIAASGPAGASTDPLEAVRQLLGYIPTFMFFREQAAQRLRPLLSREFQGDFAEANPYRELLAQLDHAGQLAGRETISQSMYLWSRTILQNFFLTACGDRSEMAHSVEGRVPFLDHQVVEWMRSLPASMKIRGTTRKHLLRAAVQPFVTGTAHRAQKKDFVTQPSRISQPHSPMGTLLQDTLRGPGLAANPFFDAPAVLKVLDSLHAQDADPGRQWDAALLNILGSCLLQNAYRL